MHFSTMPPLARMPGNFYLPWMILVWAGEWGSHYSSQFTAAGSVGIMVAAFGLLLLLASKSICRRAAAPIPICMAPRAGRVRRISRRRALPRHASLLDRLPAGRSPGCAGVYVGAWLDRKGRQHYLRHAGPEHVLCYAPTRSGKGVGLIVPTLLSWRESAVITDLKGELWELTAGWRKQHAGNRVLRFEPAALAGAAHWNPLEEIRLGSEHEVGDVQNLATLIVDPDGRGLETHWQKSAQALLVGVILHALYQAKEQRRGSALAIRYRCAAVRSRPRYRGIVDGDVYRPAHAAGRTSASSPPPRAT